MRLTAAGARTYGIRKKLADGTRPFIRVGTVGIDSFEGPPDAPGALDLIKVGLLAVRKGMDRNGIEQAIFGSRTAARDRLDDIKRDYEAAGYPLLRGGRVGSKRPSTIKADKDRYEKWLKPTLGHKTVSDITNAAVARWLDKIPTQGQRDHSLTLLKSLLGFAATRGYPGVHRIDLKPNRSREVADYYSAEELERLDAAIVSMIAGQPHRILPFSALRLLLMTGARRGEICALRWRDLDLKRGVIMLERDKTSENRRDILLRPEAVATLAALPKTSSPFVFPSDSKSGHVYYLEKCRTEAAENAGVRKVRLHDLRHSFAASAIRSGVTLYVTGALLGHRQATTTQRYAHLEDGVTRKALDRIARTVKLNGAKK
ncbi:tyrosine-type recombinase/integrase [Mesorhizobium muleiense]|uniref:tyrosine-type recombinase/integrase n=1 Tax=Mesorhizobium muleiense TaxID=1004279 RepID=UPI003AFB6477